MNGAVDRVFSLDLPRSPALRGILERASGLATLDRVYNTRPSGLDSASFLSWTFEILGVELRVADADLRRIPQSGPLLVVANHPFGGIEGMALALALYRMRPDVKLLANFLLGRIPELRELFLFVDPFARPSSNPTRKACRSCSSTT